MNQERRTETEHLIGEAQQLAVECQLQKERGSAKYTTTDAWLKAGGDLSDRISDMLTEEQDAAVSRQNRSERDHDDLLATSEHLEDALESANDAVDALGNAEYEDAEKCLEETISALRRAMG